MRLLMNVDPAPPQVQLRINWCPTVAFSDPARSAPQASGGPDPKVCKASQKQMGDLQPLSSCSVYISPAAQQLLPRRSTSALRHWGNPPPSATSRWNWAHHQSLLALCWNCSMHCRSPRRSNYSCYTLVFVGYNSVCYTPLNTHFSTVRNPDYWIGCLNQPKVLTQTSVYDWQHSCATQRLEVPLRAFPLLTFENVGEDLEFSRWARGSFHLPRVPPRALWRLNPTSSPGSQGRACAEDRRTLKRMLQPHE